MNNVVRFFAMFNISLSSFPHIDLLSMYDIMYIWEREFFPRVSITMTNCVSNIVQIRDEN